MNKFENKRHRVLETVQKIIDGDMTLAKVQYYDRVAVAALGLIRGVISVEQISPKMARAVAEQLVKDAPWREMHDKADLGTSVHDWAEKIVLGVLSVDDVPEELRLHVDGFLQFWRDLDLVFEATEFTVYSRTHGYAGTGDFMARSRRYPEMGLILGDYKTSRSGIWPDIALQLAALRYADFIGLPDNSEIPIPGIDTCMGVQLTAEGYSYVVVDAGKQAFGAFCHAIETARWTTETSKSVLGNIMTSSSDGPYSQIEDSYANH